MIVNLGGPNAVSAGLEINGEHPSSGSVTMWGQRGTVPYKWRHPFFEFTQKRGLSIGREDVGLPENAAA